MVPNCLAAGFYAYRYPWAPWAHPKWGGDLAGGFPCSVRRAKGGPETSPCIAGSWVGAQDPSAPLPLPGHGPCPAGHAGPRWNGWGSGGAGHLTLLRWGRSLAPPRRVSRPPRQLNTACGLPPRTGASSSKRGVRGLRGRAERQPQGPAVCCPAPEKPLSPCWC